MPAAAVIPAPIAYIKVVAVKKLVVEFLGPQLRPRKRGAAAGPSSLGNVGLHWSARTSVLYCEKIRVFKAGVPLEYISME